MNAYTAWGLLLIAAAFAITFAGCAFVFAKHYIDLVNEGEL